MKRLKMLAVFTAGIILLTGCSGTRETPATPSGTAYFAVPQVYETAVTAPTQQEPVTAQMAFTNAEDGVDIDLTVLSSTMIYSFVYCMVTTPEEYTGMVVKMCGIATSFHNEDTDITYYACIIQDATACCSQGIEYELADGDYPEDGAVINVTGTFGTYEENGVTYCTLRDASL